MAKKINEFPKWPTDKPRYDKNWIMIFGKICPDCNGVGCSECKGLGKVDWKKYVQNKIQGW